MNGACDDMNSRTETRSTESPIDPSAILGLLVDPRHIPDWANGFADDVVGDPETGWSAVKGGQTFALRAVVAQDVGTVDYLREISPGREGGPYVRVIPRPGGGSVVVMTIPVPREAERDAVVATLKDELTALIDLAGNS
jgi:hypothetical protein